MSIFTSIYRHTLGLMLPAYHEPELIVAMSKKRKRDEDEDKEHMSRQRQSGGSEDDNEIITKRRRVDEERFAPIVDGVTFESTEIEGFPSGHTIYEQRLADRGHPARDQDRGLMPPPDLRSFKMNTVSDTIERDGRRMSFDLDGVSQLSTGTRLQPSRATPDLSNDHNMEKARRHAAATTLPPNSGVWERAEQELFFHLSYRGFEPLFPRNWMTDFRTMPLSLFEPDDSSQPPLIQAYRDNGEFHAIRELRELIDLGKKVRDKVLSSPGVKREAIIEKAVKKYIAWALRDASIKQPSSTTRRQTPLPVHVVVKLKARQTTTDCLLELRTQLHKLRSRHCQARDIHTSIERDRTDYDTPFSDNQTCMVEGSDGDLPVLYGIMVCRSILAVFTLNSRTPALGHSHAWYSARDSYHPSPAATESIYGSVTRSVSSTEANMRLKETILVSRDDEEVEDESASDPRFIADFDFSDPAKDVWNALVVAIVAMQIRSDMLLLENSGIVDNPLEDVRAGIEKNSIMDVDEDDPDA